MTDSEGCRSVVRRHGVVQTCVRLLAVTAAVVCALAFADAGAAATTRVVRYGPFTVPGGSMDMPGMVHNKLSFAVARPCLDCWVTGFKANLVYGDGSTANFNTGAMLHHVVWTSQFRSDATCGSTLLGLAGERFFASGNERTPIAFPAGYGYRVRWYDSWNMLVDLMNMEPNSQTVYIELTVTAEPSWVSLKPLKPVWLDIDECGDSEYTTPVGSYTTSWPWTSNLTGDVVAAIGHLHDYGVDISSTDVTTGATICDSIAEYPGTDPAYMGHIDRMSTCVGSPLTHIQSGDAIRLDSTYNNTTPAPLTNAMGIMLLYLHRT
jgi:hypothetical protein